MMGPGRYDAQLEQRGGGAVPISKQFGRDNKFENTGAIEYY